MPEHRSDDGPDGSPAPSPESVDALYRRAKGRFIGLSTAIVLDRWVAEEIVQDAQRRAYRIVSEAEDIAASRREGADQYASEVLFNLEEQLSEILGQIRRGIDSLRTEAEPTPRVTVGPASGGNGGGNGNSVAARFGL